MEIFVSQMKQKQRQ